MSTIELKTNLHSLIDSVNDSKILKTIYALLTKQEEEIIGYQGAKAITRKEFLKQIEQSEAEYKQGKYITFHELMEESKSWIKG